MSGGHSSICYAATAINAERAGPLGQAANFAVYFGLGNKRPKMDKDRHRRRSNRTEWGDAIDNDSQEPRFFQQQSVRTSANGVAAQVLWFNSEKGFGFVQTPDDGKAFLHVRQLESVGRKTVAEGAALTVVIQPGEKGPQVAEVLNVGPAPGRGSAPQSQPQSASHPGSGVDEVEGVVKFYNSNKGFGFISAVNGSKDIFVHASTLGRSGIAALVEGQAVWVHYAEGTRGLEARSVRLF